MEAQTLSEEDIAKYIPIIDEILKNANLATVSVKKVRNGLSEQTGVDFGSIKKQINVIITSRFDKILAEQPDIDPDHQPETKQEPPSSPALKSETQNDAADTPVSMSGSDTKKRKSSAVEDEDARLAAELHEALNGGRPSRTGARVRATKPAAKKKRKVKSKATVGSDESCNDEEPKKKRGGNNAFNRPLVLAPKLAELVGATEMSRPAVVKEIWRYVKERGLQDPNDKRYIICDEKLKPIFGDKVHMFTMNKVLNNFMYKPEEVTGHPSGNGKIKDESTPGDMLSPVKSEVSDEDADAEGDGTSAAMSQTGSIPPGLKEQDLQSY